MELTLLCMLLLSSLNILLYCGNAQDAVLTFEPNWSTFFTGEVVTFICDMKEGKDSDWFYSIWKDGREVFPYSINNRSTVPLLVRGHSGEYQCHGEKKDSRERRQSNKVSLTVSDKNVVLETPASTLFEGESVTLRCRHRVQEKNSATFYKDSSLIETNTNHQNGVEITVPLMSDGSFYKCKFDQDEESEPVKLKMEPKPKAQLSKRVTAGGSVILTCSVKPSSSSGWKYFWYRGKKTSEPLNIQHDELHVSQAGLYWCRGGRGEPVYYTEYSDPLVTNKPVVTQQPNWPEIYSGETITLICEIEGGGDAEWEYEWSTSSSHSRPTEYMISASQSGNYWCQGHLKSEGTETEWSNVFTLKLSSKNHQPVLTVSPSWLSPGDSVALNCSVKHPSAGWSFYWFKAVPKLTGSYSYELLPGSTNGTDQDLFMVHGQTHSAGYVCRAGRGDPVFYTLHSEPKFVWSGDDHPAASLSVSLDTVQHFKQEPVSLSCEGNSTEWRVSRFSIYGQWTYCSYWGTMTGSTCKLNSHWTSGVYWCESGSGEFSNAVNITVVYDNILLVSPAHPVAEGRPVTLVCKLKAEKALYDVHFYKNGKLIPNHTGGEMNISAVSKSDEGLYKCEGKESQKHALGSTSSESWMSVKYSEGGAASVMNSASPLLLIVGLVCGLLLIILLLLFLFHCRKSKDSCLMRSQSTNQGPGTDHMTNQEEPQHGDAALYESVPGSAEPENGEFGDVTYSEVELKNIVKKGKNREPEESTVYSNMKTGSGNAVSDDNLMYAQVLSHTKCKKGKGKSSPAAEDETVYSEVKPGTAFGNNAAMI